MSRHPVDPELAEPFFSAEAFKNIDPLTLFPRDNSGEVVVSRPRTRHLEISDRLFAVPPGIGDAAAESSRAHQAPRPVPAGDPGWVRAVAAVSRRAAAAGAIAFVAGLVLAIVMTVMAPVYFE
jgi:hypothetical protein